MKELHRHTRGGFTLIELSIVLVIIGLIVGGVLVGQDLIRAAEARKVMTEVERFTTAAYTFRGKYDCVAGDCPNATNFFGTNPNCGSNGAGTGTQTCNGDGNGIVDNSSSEVYLFWQHLADAGLIAGSYDGVERAPIPTGSAIGGNIPGSGISGAGYYARYLGQVTGSPSWYDGYYSNGFEFGSLDSVYQKPQAGALTPQQAYSIDKKKDDGLPATGTVRSWASGATPGCTTSDTPSIAAYNVSNGARACGLIFSNAF